MPGRKRLPMFRNGKKGAAARRMACFALLALGPALSGCDSLPSWLGDNKDKTPLPGERIAVMLQSSRVVADPALERISVELPAETLNAEWPQAGGNAGNAIGNPQWRGAFANSVEAVAGSGNGWDAGGVAIEPVVAQGKVFAMDARGFISAHDAANIATVLWSSKEAVEPDEPDILGGGLAYQDGRLFVSTGYGKIVALNSVNGELLWKESLNIPVRGAPRVEAGKLFVITVDNQLFALDIATGKPVWNHRGISENASYLGQVSPAYGEGMVIAAYTTGELLALKADSGEEAWADALVIARRNAASAIFTGIKGNPVIADGTVYAVSAGGLFAANSVVSGRRVWEQPIASLNTPWVAGNAIYVLTPESELVCLERESGRIHWVHPLPRYEDEAERKHPLRWLAPVAVGGKVVVTGTHGEAFVLSAQKGDVLSRETIVDGVQAGPVVAGGTLYVVTRKARLVAYQ